MNKLARSTAILALASALSVASAGCGEDKAAPDLTLFLGSWNPVVAAITTFCSDGIVKTITISKPTVMVMGTDSDLLDDDPTCPVKYDVAGDIARALPGQSCDNPDVITRMHLVDGTFTHEQGIMATHAASGTLDGYINISVGNTVTCTYNEMGVYRLSRD
jgi:hypothetical protein